MKQDHHFENFLLCIYSYHSKFSQPAICRFDIPPSLLSVVWSQSAEEEALKDLVSSHTDSNACVAAFIGENKHATILLDTPQFLGNGDLVM